MKSFMNSEIGRGITGALISVGISLIFILPLLLMELLHTL